MKKGIRIVILSIAIIFVLLPFSVSAWRPDYSFRCSVDNYLMPDNTVYIDLLMPISVNDDAYIDFNDKNGELYNISKESEIAKYNVDGYISYTFHIKDAKSQMLPENCEVVFADSYDVESEFDYDYCRKKFKKIKIAYLTAEGDIISVTNSAKVTSLKPGAPQLHINISGNTLTVDIVHGPPVYWIVLLPVSVLLIIVIYLIIIITRLITVKKNT